MLQPWLCGACSASERAAFPAAGSRPPPFRYEYRVRARPSPSDPERRTRDAGNRSVWAASLMPSARSSMGKSNRRSSIPGNAASASIASRLEMRNRSASLTWAGRSDHSASDTAIHTADLSCFGPSGSLAGRRASPFLKMELGTSGDVAKKASTSNSVPMTLKVHIGECCSLGLIPTLKGEQKGAFPAASRLRFLAGASSRTPVTPLLRSTSVF